MGLHVSTSGGLSGISSDNQISTVASSSSIISAEMTFFLRVPERFFIDELGGLGHNLTLGMTKICSFSCASLSYSGTYRAMYSIMSIGDAVSTVDSAT